MTVLKRIFAIALGALSLSSCSFVSSVVHDGEVAARVGKHTLYKSDLARYIPAGIPSADSTNLALQYINSWATDMLFLDVAEVELSKTELDVTEDLEAYRRSLLRFRYEQLFVSDRLDTLVTDAQMREFYNSHKALFQLQNPVMKVRFISILKTSPKKDYIIKKMASNKPSDVLEADSLAYKYAISYFDKSEDWTDAQVVADAFGVSIKTLLSNYSKPYIRIENRNEPDIKVAYVRDMRESGPAPIEYCEEAVKDYILSSRKHELLMDLERDLLRQALDQDKFVIY